jgi:hypothetical protein
MGNPMVEACSSTRRAAAGVDLDDLTHCPQADRCAGCGGPGDLAVATAETVLGVLCLTVCAHCAEAARLPRLSCGQAADRVAVHCGHLAITVDDMAALLTLPGGAR